VSDSQPTSRSPWTVLTLPTCAELCTKVAKALKETGGASSEYQNVIFELHGLQNALARLAALEPTESNISHVNAIRGMALACRLPLQDFLSRVEKYESTMGPMAPISMRGAGKKAKWAVFMIEEVKRIRAVISAKVISINLLLATHASETLSKLESRGGQRHGELISKIGEHRSRLDKLTTQVEEVKEEVVQSRDTAIGATKRMGCDVQSKFDTITQNTTNITENLATLSIDMASTRTSLMNLRSLGVQIMAFLRTFPSELRDLLQTILRTNTQMYFMLLNLQNSVSTSPTLLLQSNIRFEDALGVVRELPHEWFRHWEVVLL
jgi:hypothetical protein